MKNVTLYMKTAEPKAQLHLAVDGRLIDSLQWEAHRQLAATLHEKINELLSRNDFHIDSISAVVVFEGPGSFTGLRIGMSVANALCYSYSIPVITQNDTDWLNLLDKNEFEKPFAPVKPIYGSNPHITNQKK